jgi:hypothetical protein
MQIIPLQAVPSQTVNVSLAGQSCTIDVYQKGILPPFTPADATSPNVALLPAVVYLDLYVANVLIVGGVRCMNGVAIVRYDYLGFTGDLAFYDTQGATDPVYTGLGGRYVLAYLSPGDIPGTSVQTLQT